MQPCLPRQPVHKPGRKHLQLQIYWRRPMLLWTLPRTSLAQPRLCSWFNNWQKSLAANWLSLSCRRLWQWRWVVKLDFFTCFHRSSHLAKLPWQLSWKPSYYWNNKGGGGTHHFNQIYCFQHWAGSRVWSLWLRLPDNRGWGRDNLDGEELRLPSMEPTDSLVDCRWIPKFGHFSATRCC